MYQFHATFRLVKIYQMTKQIHFDGLDKQVMQYKATNIQGGSAFLSFLPSATQQFQPNLKNSLNAQLRDILNIFSSHLCFD